MLTEPVDRLTEVLPTVVAEVIPELACAWTNTTPPGYRGLPAPIPQRRQTFMKIGFPFQILMTRMELSSSPAPTLSIRRAADEALIMASTSAIERSRPRTKARSRSRRCY